MGFLDFLGDVGKEIKSDVGQIGSFGLDVFRQTQAVPLAVIGGGFGLANNVGGKLAGGVGGAVDKIGGGLGQIGGGLGSTLQYLPIILIGGAVIFGIVELKKAMK